MGHVTFTVTAHPELVGTLAKQIDIAAHALSGPQVRIWSVTYLPPRVVDREFPKEGIYREKIRQILSTPFRPKIDQNGLKTTLNGVGRASRGIGQLIAPSSSNISPWGPTSTPFKPMFIDFLTFSENHDRFVRNSFRKNEFLMAPLAKVLSGKCSYIGPLIFISLSNNEIRLHFYRSYSTCS